MNKRKLPTGWVIHENDGAAVPDRLELEDLKVMGAVDPRIYYRETVEHMRSLMFSGKAGDEMLKSHVREIGSMSLVDEIASGLVLPVLSDAVDAFTGHPEVQWLALEYMQGTGDRWVSHSEDAFSRIAGAIRKHTGEGALLGKGMQLLAHSASGPSPQCHTALNHIETLIRDFPENTTVQSNGDDALKLILKSRNSCFEYAKKLQSKGPQK